MEQAGYDQSDGMELLNSDVSFLLKFVYKSQLLGPTVHFPYPTLLYRTNN
jgi:adenylate cyclase